MQSIAELFPLLVKELPENREVQEGIIRISWNFCVGEQIRKISTPVSFDRGILKIRVSSSQWQSVLSSMKPEIIRKINRYLNRPLLKDIEIGIQ